ncbi:hypothetical protein ASE94_15960 [Devosia sp. Leaf64]|nr:hypothetical protein ASE94_15960 [Devosia sp. Leaf64]
MIVRVPDFPPKQFKPITRLSQFRDAGIELISHCSSGDGHSHQIDLAAALETYGDAEVDYDFKQKQLCPDCGAPGGGLTIRAPAADQTSGSSNVGM